MKGSDAELIALSYLQGCGLMLAARNYRCRFGEIDLVMTEDKTLVFVEVRMRASDTFGGAAASITAAKKTKLLRTARHYLSGLNHGPACRFDVILITGKHQPEIEWIKNAFGE